MKPKKIPMRMCVGCREMKEKRDLIRIVRTPEGDAVLDPTGKNPAEAPMYAAEQNACSGQSGRNSWKDSLKSR